MKVKDFETAFDSDEDITEYLDREAARRFAVSNETKVAAVLGRPETML